MIQILKLNYVAITGLCLTFLMGALQLPAQAAGTITVFNELTNTNVSSSNANLNFKFKVVVWDAVTKKPITSDTTQIDYGLIIANDSPYSFKKTEIVSSHVVLSNVGANIQDELLGAGTPISFGLPVYSSNFVALPHTTPLVFKNVNTKSGIIMRMDFSFKITDQAGNILVLFPIAGDMVYMPSNADLIPAIFNKVVGTTPTPTPDTYTVTVTSGVNGSITPAGVTSVKAGTASPVFSVKPAAGYVIEQLLLDGKPVSFLPSGITLYFGTMVANHTISATFK
jgi:hypothetical protein